MGNDSKRQCDFCENEFGEWCIHPQVKKMEDESNHKFEGDLWREEQTPKWCPLIMEDLIRRQDALNALNNVSFDCSMDQEAVEEEILKLPAVVQQKGKWLYTGSEDEWYGQIFRCSLCGSEMMGEELNYCPKCGHPMEMEWKYRK